MLSTMFDKRNLVRHFWRAQADLKTLLYSFEDTWRGRTVNAEKESDQTGEDQSANDPNINEQSDQSSNVQNHDDQNANDQNASSLADDGQRMLCLDQAFLDDLKVHIHQARQIKRQEQDEFFARYDSAFSNLSDILGFAHKHSTEVASVMQTQRRERAELLTSTRGEIDELGARSQAIAIQLDQHRRELEGLQGASTPFDDARRAALMSAIDSLHREHLDASLRLQTARVRLQRVAPH
jgi:hypothetical protein